MHIQIIKEEKEEPPFHSTTNSLPPSYFPFLYFFYQFSHKLSFPESSSHQIVLIKKELKIWQKLIPSKIPFLLVYQTSKG